MEKATRGWTLGELAELLGGSLDGPGQLWITGPAGLETGGDSNLAFAENEDYLAKVLESNVAAVITYREAPKSDKPFLRVDQPKQAFGKFLGLCQNTMPLALGTHPSAVVSPEAYVSPTASVGAYVIVESGARIEDGARVFPFVYVGANCSIGTEAIIYPHVVLYSDVSIGHHSIIHSHAVLGSDGFGFTWNGSEHVKVPHLGGVKIDANVEIGAGTTIDRGMMGLTSVGEGSKIDNQVQIAHNCVIGKNTIIVSQTGISGSCVIGDRVKLAGQVGLADHVRIGDDVILTARSAVASDVLKSGPYRGAPALPYSEELRMEASLRKVPQLLKRVKELEKKLARLSPSNDDA